jgi:hypothetical protein
MEKIDMSLDDIIKDNRKKSKQNVKPNPNVANEGGKTGPIRTRAAGKKLTRQTANPYPVRSFHRDPWALPRSARV